MRFGNLVGLFLIAFTVVAIEGRKRCNYTLSIGLEADLDNKRDQDWPSMTFFHPANTACTYRIEAPFGYRIGASCRIPQTIEEKQSNETRLAADCDGRVLISSTLNPGFDSFHCEAFRKDSEANLLMLEMQSNSKIVNSDFQCTISLIPPRCTCGERNKNMGKIVNGDRAGEHEFPMMAALFDYRTHEQFCGATIISDSNLLTAAHCVYDIYGDYYLAVGGDLNTGARIYTEIVAVTHPEYNPHTVVNDIAILRTKKIIFNQNVGPACLPWKFRDTFAGKSIEVSGWGKTSFQGNVSEVLLKVTLDVVNTEVCSARLSKRLTSGQMCTYTPDKDACQGDSGGPLFYTEPESGRLYLVGIISYGFGCATENPGVNTRVTAYLNWIEKETRGTTFCRV